ncbi:glycine cleavage system protein GcvH [Pseudonocardia sp. KRD-184]|uniref:Glycine cleavage system H protein n=1 Tax=Pseudonocardia oceani TaxID=2792013 RepID=A0ABS6UDD5_9PSEU|nr:glycine cleavage system protein GcvH [Pseudonocardia oceani]MBW0089137.1 glycine cleavage system protein GcvH [Pseudonocardia oceani]MBW0095973.1 glycine cleavage system protein GcvH [Pseudonocardia oceani]MBW0108861.1 glycine cleavage system protein GcvH [Pseudonocardia oceani]MBW0120204.1 glycine cleavage system protein GcvH [Pseudonocardia oceani]MBW0130248.1 glycine cleavage system protein GcvH [Pseudonocardia oceani]
MTAVHIPDDLSYTTDHEWIDVAPGSSPSGGGVRVGLSAVATEALGEIVFVDLPAVGTDLTAGEVCGEIESTKSVSELVSPASGTVVSINEALGDDPALVGEDPYGEGWLFTIEIAALGEVLDASGYRAANEG